MPVLLLATGFSRTEPFTRSAALQRQRPKSDGPLCAHPAVGRGPSAEGQSRRSVAPHKKGGRYRLTGAPAAALIVCERAFA